MIKRAGEKITSIIFITILIAVFVIILSDARAIGSTVIKGYDKYNSKGYSLFDVIRESINDVASGIDTAVSGNTPLIDINGAFERSLGKRIVNDSEPQYTVYRMDNGQLTFNYPESDIEDSVENMDKLYTFLKSKNTSMLYIQAPSKIDKYNPQLPRGILDTTNSNADIFLRNLSEHGVPYYDLREVIHDKRMDYPSLFYDTDIHWKTETAFWAYTQVSMLLEKNYGLDIDPEKISQNQFSYTQYKDCFLGILGRRTGRYYGGIDDYTLVLPRFHTDYIVQINDSNDLITKGTFTNTIIDKNRINMNLPISTTRYSSYFGGNHPKVEITNNMVEDGSVLILNDSFGIPFSAFLSLNFHKTVILDLRRFDDETIMEHLQNNRYDMVVLLYYPPTIRDKKMFAFN